MRKIGVFKKKDKYATLSVQTRPTQHDVFSIKSGERGLYRALRENVPIIDASIDKLRRLIGDFVVNCPNQKAEKELAYFLKNVKVNAVSTGMDSFIGLYFEELLTYGNAVGEIVLSGDEIYALYNAPLSDIVIEEGENLTLQISCLEEGKKIPCRYPQLLLASALNPPAGQVEGISILRGLPFVSGILLKIYNTIGTNWDRAGNVRFAVTTSADASSGIYAKERAEQMAEEWKRAMRSHEVSDFVAVGDVSIKAIGADNQILDSEIPVRQMLEQVVAKMGVPPFLLGLSWSSTERMSSQQADILTSELDSYRRLLTPVIEKICRTWLVLQGYESECAVEWNEITMQDEVDHANARYLNAKSEAIEREWKGEEE
ncbi:phage portal protein [Scatolibacter rhodanostii]|uniref:phage portal protein n=1 Tax=Scatolibacter rhodanostii TaxID=2014781 RepID=UPI001FA941B6|nr:phage portal protein [Scatolibacter rhodanostii]